MRIKEKLLDKEDKKLDYINEYSAIVNHNRYMAK